MALLLSAAAFPSAADEADELRKLRDSTIALVNALVEQGVLSREKADAIIAKALQGEAKPPATAGSGAAQNAGGAPGSSAPGAATPGPPVVRVPYIPESVKEDITNQVRQDVLAQARTERWGVPDSFPDWLKRFYFYGDLRLRFQADRFPTDGGQPNAPVQTLQAYGVNIANSTEANNRARFRARFGFDATVSDSVTVGIRLATGGVGSGSNPGSENQTLGNYETRSSLGIDRAFIAYHPLSWFEVSGGRVGMPFFKPTSLVWADDVSLEGFLVHLHPEWSDNLKFFAIAGLFPILQIDPIPTNSADSKWLYAYQAGVDAKFDDVGKLKVGAALYDYRHIEGTPNPTIYSTAYSGSAAPYRQTGNTVFDINGLLNTLDGTQNYLWGLASKFHVLNLSASLDLDFVGPAHVIIDGDWVKNLGFNEQEIFERTGDRVDPQVRGWQTRFTVGYPTMQPKYAWQVYVGYRYVQRDATLDAFTDQDFHLGGTDAQGYFLGARYSFEKNTFINLRWFSAKQIDGVELAGADSVLSGLPLAIDVAQLDVMSSF